MAGIRQFPKVSCPLHWQLHEKQRIARTDNRGYKFFQVKKRCIVGRQIVHELHVAEVAVLREKSANQIKGDIQYQMHTLLEHWQYKFLRYQSLLACSEKYFAYNEAGNLQPLFSRV